MGSLFPQNHIEVCSPNNDVNFISFLFLKRSSKTTIAPCVVIDDLMSNGIRGIRDCFKSLTSL